MVNGSMTDRRGRGAAWPGWWVQLLPGALVLGLLSACGGGSARPAEVPSRPTSLVVVRGVSAHALGEEIARDAEGRVEVALHDGTRGWYEAEEVRRATLSQGDLVVVRWNGLGAVYTAVVVQRFDRLLRVRFDQDQSVSLVPLSAVVAVLDAPLEGTEELTTTPEDPEGQALPEVDPATQVALELLDGWVPVRALRCGDGVTVLLPGGETLSVPSAMLSASPLAAGDRVAARYQSGNLSYLAAVEEVDGARVRVRYEDDGSEEWLPVDMLTVVLRPAAAPPTSRANPPICRRLRGADVPIVLLRHYRVMTAATVEACSEEDEAQLVDRNGGRHRVPAADLSRLPLLGGDTVLVPWGESNFLSTVTAVDGYRLAVRYEDGSSGQVSLGQVRMLFLPHDQERTGEPFACQ